MQNVLAKALARPGHSLPDIARMPDEALLTRRQLAGLTGFTEQAFKLWARNGRGPAVLYVEGRPRTTVRAYREWVAGAQQAAS